MGYVSWYGDCVDDLIGSGSGFNPYCYSRRVFYGGYPCTDFSASEDWSMGEGTFSYTFPSADVEWFVRYVLLCSDDLSNGKNALQIN